MTRNEAIGWWSEEASQAQAEEVLTALRQNWRTGQGPQTLNEMRASNSAIREEKEQARIKAEKESISLTAYWEKTYLPSA